MFLDHPSRRARDVASVAETIARLSSIGRGLFDGAEGAPGHQHQTPLGAYRRTLTPEDRWDPAIVPAGAIWDRHLAAGSTLSGALATSDFHSVENGDYWPCQFSATWIYAPDRSIQGVLRALRAGSFFGVHGDIARRVQLLVTAEGMTRPAIPGERLHAPAGTALTVEVRAEVPALDWAGHPNRVDLIQVLGASRAGTAVLGSGPLDNGVFRCNVRVPAGGFAIRARGRRVVQDGPDLLFYTNAVQVR